MKKRVSEITASIEWESGAGEKVRGERAKKRSKQKRINALSSQLKVMFLLFTRGGRHATLDINRYDRLVPAPLIQITEHKNNIYNNYNLRRFSFNHSIIVLGILTFF